jgi:hypothetical protein
MSYKKLSKEFTSAELAEAFVFPKKLSPKQQREADKQLAYARQLSMEKMTAEEQLAGNMMGLKFRMEDYFNGDKPKTEYSFGYFLKLYISLLGRKRREFAFEIGIDETLLSQLVNQHRLPPDYMPIRLELHSNKWVPAEYWFRTVEKDREKALLANKAAMLKREKKFVKGGIAVGA